MRVLLLYTELAEYVLKCCEALCVTDEVHIVRYPVNSEAPFQFNFVEGISVYERRSYDQKGLRALAKNIQPDLIICSGWIDKDYLKVVGDFAGKIPTVMTCDTHWRGDFKQQMARILSRFFLIPKFSHAWVPGEIQATYARKLGFAKERIKRGFYTCDLHFFNTYFSPDKIKARATKRRFIYVGRYYEFKGVEDLWQAFLQFEKTSSQKWELWCLGTGDIKPIEHPGIKHFGFVQPKDMGPLLEETSVFILPSRFEPWAVVVHEFAAAGFPLVLSKEVGAASTLLSEGSNGFSFEAGNIQALQEALTKMANLPEKALTSMSEKSHQLAQSISPEHWVKTVKEICNEGA